jgi:hypothetical protein
MNIQLIEGEFNTTDAMELIMQMIHAKIKFHENKIMKSEVEEDIKRREAKIKRLQKDLFDIRNNINLASKSIKLNAVLQIQQ